MLRAETLTAKKSDLVSSDPQFRKYAISLRFSATSAALYPTGIGLFTCFPMYFLISRMSALTTVAARVLFAALITSLAAKNPSVLVYLENTSMVAKTC